MQKHQKMRKNMDPTNKPGVNTGTWEGLAIPVFQFVMRDDVCNKTMMF
jgi:hypothetical protein